MMHGLIDGRPVDMEARPFWPLAAYAVDPRDTAERPPPAGWQCVVHQRSFPTRTEAEVDRLREHLADHPEATMFGLPDGLPPEPADG